MVSVNTLRFIYCILYVKLVMHQNGQYYYLYYNPNQYYKFCLHTLPENHDEDIYCSYR
eukprot:UN14041